MQNTKSNWVTVLLIGSIWGFLEATLGGFLHFLHLPIAGKIMAPIGFALMFWGSKNGLKVHQLIFVSLIAASLKFSDVFLFGLPFFHIKIVNPAQAIAMQGFCFAGVSALYTSLFKSPRHMALGSIAVFVSTFFLAALFSQFIMNHTMGSLSIGMTATIFHLTIGSILTFAGFATIQFSFEKSNLFQIARLSFRTQSVLAVLLIVTSVAMRSWLA